MMARTVAELPKGSRITDYISLGVLNTMIPRTAVDAALTASNRQSIRQRDLPAHVMVYYVIALALYMQSSYREVVRCLLEGLQWLSDPSARPRVVGKSGISQARTRLGAEPLQALHDAVVRPVGRASEPGCGYRRWHLVSIDGSGLDVADEHDNAAAFGRPGASRGASAFPQIRFVSLVENGTHVLFGSRMAGCAVGEQRLAHDVLPVLSAGMLCLADRNFFGYQPVVKVADPAWPRRGRVSYTERHGNGQETGGATGVAAVGDDGGAADERGAPILRASQPGSGSGRVRRFRRGVVRGVLRGADGPAESASWAVFPDAVHRLFRGPVVGARDCVAGGRFSEPAVVPGLGCDRAVSGSLDAVADASVDRRGDARGGFHVGSGAAG